ncbi:hypothetical protein HY212_04290 [Candidatus Pacearchaeota archaeon]|nr:hypothetical protein [Candidatus Pacearchaeota archaeon]
MTREKSPQPVRGSMAIDSSMDDNPVAGGLNARQMCATRHFEQAMYDLGLVTWTGNNNFAQKSGYNHYSLEDH